MSDPDRLSPEVLANLRAIHAGEPWRYTEIAVPLFAVFPPSDFVQNSTWRLTSDGAAVLALADERDALLVTADLNAAMEKMEAVLLEWSSGVRRGSGSEGCIKLWYDSAIGQFCIEGEDLRTAKRDRLASTILWWANPRKKPERAPEHKALSARCILAEDRVAALERECDALRQRVADFERLLVEPRVEQERLIALRDIVTRLYVSATGYATIGEAETKALQDEVLAALPDVFDEALVANTFRRLAKGVAGALGLLEMQKDAETGESYLPSWHDLPEQVVGLAMADARVNALDNRVREIFTAPITAEEGIERLVRDRADLRKHVAEINAKTLRPAPDDLLGQRLVNGRASLPDDTPTWVGELLTEAWTAIQALRADGRAKAAQVASADAEIERLTAEGDEAQALAEKRRLELAAELGQPEGAPSARWTCDGRTWYGARPDGGMDKIEWFANLNGDGTVTHTRGWTDQDRFGFEKERGRFKMAYSAMLAADASMAAGGGQ